MTQGRNSESSRTRNPPIEAQRRRKVLAPLTDRVASPLDLEAHLPYRIAVVSNLLLLDRDPLIRNLTKLGLRELRVLLNVGSYMPVRAADIAYQTRLGSFTVSRAVKTLLTRGLVRSDRNPLDARDMLLALTRKGSALYAAMSGLLERRAALVAAVLSAQEQALLLDMLGRLEDSAEKVLTEEALSCMERGGTLSVEQKELLRWFKRGSTQAAPR
jgi:DNA-binding MarR family transcriptional regulator